MPSNFKALTSDDPAKVPASEVKPKSPRRRAGSKRKPTAAKTAGSGQAKAQDVTLRSKAAMVKLQNAVDQLEAALKEQEAATAVIPPPPVAEPKPAPPVANIAPPAPPRPVVEVEPAAWMSAMRPAMATGAFLIIVAALIVGYSTGHAVGTDEVADAMVLIASAADEPTADQAATPIRASTQAVASREPKPSPTSAPLQERILAAAPSGNVSGLHLQVSALKSIEAAVALGARLENAGYPVKVRKPEADGFVRVFVGPVGDGDQLAAIATRLRAEGLRPFPKRL